MGNTVASSISSTLLRQQVEKVLSLPAFDEKEVGALFELAETDKHGYLSVQEVTHTMELVYRVELNMFCATMRRLFHDGRMWDDLNERVYHFESQFANPETIKSRAREYASAVNRHHDIRIMRADYYAWFINHLAIPLDERLGIESAPLYSWSNCCRPPRFGLSKSNSVLEHRKMGIFVGDILCERIFLLKNFDGIVDVVEVPDVYHYLLSFLFEVYESINANLPYDSDHHCNFTGYETLNNLKNPDNMSKAKLACLLMLGHGPKSRLRLVNTAVTVGEDIDVDERLRADQLFSECAPALLERVENATATASETQILAIMRYYGWSVPVDADMTLQLFELASQGRDPNACSEMADYLLQKGFHTVDKAVANPKKVTSEEQKLALENIADAVSLMQESAKTNVNSQARLYEYEVTGTMTDFIAQHENGVKMSEFKRISDPMKGFSHLSAALANGSEYALHRVGSDICEGGQSRDLIKQLFNADEDVGFRLLLCAAFHRSHKTCILLKQLQKIDGTSVIPEDSVPKTYVVDWSRIVAWLRSESL